MCVSATELELASPFGKHMVLQRQQPIPMWGWAKPGQSITVKVAGLSGSTVVRDDGRRPRDLPALGVGGPHVFTITDGQATIMPRLAISEQRLYLGLSNPP